MITNTERTSRWERRQERDTHSEVHVQQWRKTKLVLTTLSLPSQTNCWQKLMQTKLLLTVFSSLTTSNT